MKKKILALTMVILMLALLFVGCGQGTEESNSLAEESSREEIREESSFRETYGDEKSRKTLNVCIDMGKYSNQFDGSDFLWSAMDKFVKDVKYSTGMDEVSVLFLPGEGAERESVLDRLRVEIMSGGGPDVFMLRGTEGPGNYANVLIRFPEKSMETGLFLPLDEYMENNTRFTDWDAQTKVVLDAGRSEEGQVIIPLAYTLPVLVYPKDEIRFEPSADVTMQDILNDPDCAELSAVMYNGVGKKETDSIGGEGWPTHEDHLAFMLGKLADFENEELLFTAEDLMGIMDTMCSLREPADANPLNYIEENVGMDLCLQFSLTDFDREMKMIPLYSRDGGVTATVISYAAVNRNTSYPLESFTVIDMMMQEKAQQENNLYDICFLSKDGIPLQNDLCREEKPLSYTHPYRYLEQPYYDDLCAIKEQITHVRFRNEIDLELESLIDDLALDYLLSGSYNKEAVSESYEVMKRMIGE